MPPRETDKFCNVCQTTTKHKVGHCVECEDEVIRNEAVKWMRTKRKCLVAATGVFLVAVSNWLLASHYSGDDVGRTAIQGLIVAIGVWVGSSLKKEEETRAKEVVR